MLGSISSMTGLYTSVSSYGGELTRTASQNGQGTPAPTTTPSNPTDQTQSTSQTSQTPGLPKSSQTTQPDGSLKPDQTRQTSAKSEKKDENTDAKGLTRAQESEVSSLISTDRKVRAHEQAHIAVGGNLVRGGPNYDYHTGPDKNRYAVGGEVEIDTSAVKNDPEATIRKAEHIRAAALAPADPSPQDYRVADAATHMELQAEADLRAANFDKNKTQSHSQESKKTSSPVLDAMLRKAYEASTEKGSQSALTSVLGAISA